MNAYTRAARRRVVGVTRCSGNAGHCQPGNTRTSAPLARWWLAIGKLLDLLADGGLVQAQLMGLNIRDGMRMGGRLRRQDG